MYSAKLISLVALSLFAISLPARITAQETITPKVQSLIDDLQKILPEYEQAADGFEQSIQQLADSTKVWPPPSPTDHQVTTALDCARLQILSIRSVGKIIAEQPNYLQYHVSPANLPRWKEGAEYYLDCARSQKDPFAGMTSGVRPFRSKIDGQLLLYKFSLPKDYDPAKKYPLRVHLHAGGGFTWLAYWVTGKPDNQPRNGANDGAIHITPAGRQHIGMGEVAVLDAIANTKRHYNIDDDRVIIGGASWGGTGGFHFATFLPDQFAAAHSLTGGGNYNLPVGNGRYDAYLLADNLANLPFLIWDTPGDGHYKANHAFADSLRLFAQTHSGFYPHLELTDPKGGHGIIDRKLQDEGWAWMNQQVRNRYPRRVIYQTHWLRYDGAYWARIDTMVDPTAPARIDVHLKDNVCEVAVENADRFHLDLTPALVGDLKELSVHINGGDALLVSTGKTVYFHRMIGKWTVAQSRYPEGLIKKRGLSGPIQDVFMQHPVLMVYGTRKPRDPVATTKMLDNIANRLISTGDGSGVLRSGFQRKSTSEIDDNDLEKNLIVVGTPSENALFFQFLVKRDAHHLPVTFLDDGVEIAGKQHRGPDIGLLMVYPNPLNPERYILLVPEEYSGGKPLDYPDYVVFQSPQDGKGQSRILAKGTFDAHWREAR